MLSWSHWHAHWLILNHRYNTPTTAKHPVDLILIYTVSYMLKLIILPAAVTLVVVRLHFATTATANDGRLRLNAPPETLATPRLVQLPLTRLVFPPEAFLREGKNVVSGLSWLSWLSWLRRVGCNACCSAERKGWWRFEMSVMRWLNATVVI